MPVYACIAATLRPGVVSEYGLENTYLASVVLKHGIIGYHPVLWPVDQSGHTCLHLAFLLCIHTVLMASGSLTLDVALLIQLHLFPGA